MSEVDALQTTLAGEHAAVHLYGVLGARTSRSATPMLYDAVVAAYRTHRERRDVLSRFVRDEGAEPVAAEPTYEIPARPDSVERVEAEALALERRCASTYAWLVAHTTGSRRRWAVSALTDAAVRGLTFLGSPEIFPGAGEYADR